MSTNTMIDTLSVVTTQKLQKCKFGVKCTKLDCPHTHPEKDIDCYFGAKCTKKDCIYKHPEKIAPKDIDCYFGAKCTKKDCIYKHPEKIAPKDINCYFGAKCTKKDCHYKHPEKIAPKEKTYTQLFNHQINTLCDMIEYKHINCHQELFDAIINCDDHYEFTDKLDLLLQRFFNIVWEADFNFNLLVKSRFFSFGINRCVTTMVCVQPLNYVKAFLEHYYPSLPKNVLSCFCGHKNTMGEFGPYCMYPNPVCVESIEFMMEHYPCLKFEVYLLTCTNNFNLSTKLIRHTYLNHREMFHEYLSDICMKSRVDYLDYIYENREIFNDITPILKFCLEKDDYFHAYDLAAPHDYLVTYYVHKVCHIDIFDRIINHYSEAITNVVIKRILTKFEYSVDIIKRLDMLGKFVGTFCIIDDIEVTLLQYLQMHVLPPETISYLIDNI